MECEEHQPPILMDTLSRCVHVADEGVGVGGGGVGEGPGAVLRIPPPQSTNTNSKPSNTVLRIAHLK
jgi:hypothetical protein